MHNSFLNLAVEGLNMLPPEKIKELQDAIAKLKNPFYIFDDDPDGLCAFLLLYRTIKNGRPYCLKAKHSVDAEMVSNVERYGPDSIFVLDVPEINQEFIDAVGKPVYWIDHHGPEKREKVHYFNPRALNQPLLSTTGLCWLATQKYRPEDLWIASIGLTFDWFFTDVQKEFQKQRPDILPPETSVVEEALFNTRLGTLSRVFSFVLKGDTKEVNTDIKILTRIENPDEILQQTTSRGKRIWKKYLKVNTVFEELRAKALKTATKDKMFIFIYPENKYSVTNDLANELLYRLKDKVVIIGRTKDGQLRCSVRSPANITINTALSKAIEGLDAYGGGHEHACGAGIKEEDFQKFVENFRRELNL
jgi:single-stranded DNA-specific DHH superfamily exonuclease